MTTDNEPRVVVTQEDWKAAKGLWQDFIDRGPYIEDEQQGRDLAESWLQAFARHRIATEDACRAREAELVVALAWLEQECERLAASRPQAAYDAYIDAGQADALNALDVARQRARAVLARAKATTDATGEGK